MRRDAGRTEAFIDDLEEALMYATAQAFTDIIPSLQEALVLALKTPIELEQCIESIEIAVLLRILGEEHGFDTETCDDIGGMTLADAFETAYSYLTQAGLDANEILAHYQNG